MRPALELKHNLSKIISTLEAYESRHGMGDLFKYLESACNKQNNAEVVFILQKIINGYEAIIKDMDRYITLSTKIKYAQIENLQLLKDFEAKLR